MATITETNTRTPIAPATAPSLLAILSAPMLFLVRLNLAAIQHKKFMAQDTQQLSDMGISAAERDAATIWQFLEFPRR